MDASTATVGAKTGAPPGEDLDTDVVVKQIVGAGHCFPRRQTFERGRTLDWLGPVGNRG